MRTKIVYSVVSSAADYYLEQTLMSVYSLKLYNKNACVVLVVDNTTRDSMTGSRAEILKYVSEVISVDIPSEYSKMQKSRFLKTSLRQYIKGDYLFIDSDTLVTASLEDVDSFDFEMGATADKHVVIGKHPMKVFIDQCAKIAGFSVLPENIYVNSGVMFFKDTPQTHQFYERWHNNWKLTATKELNIDQASLAKTCEEFNFPITDIGGIWNCQLTDNGLRYLADAKIIHYFASTAKGHIKSAFTYYQDEIYDRIKETGKLPQDIVDIISNPKKEFTEQCQIITKEDIPLMRTAIHVVYEEHPKMFHFLNNLAKIYLKL